MQHNYIFRYLKNSRLLLAADLVLTIFSGCALPLNNQFTVGHMAHTKHTSTVVFGIDFQKAFKRIFEFFFFGESVQYPANILVFIKTPEGPRSLTSWLEVNIEFIVFWRQLIFKTVKFCGQVTHM